MSIIGGIAGSLIGGLFGNSAQSSANRANIKLNRENRDWSERMSNTEWARGVQDMKAAGLNPMLAFSQGGASTPSNSAATVIPEDGMARGISSAADKLMQAQSIRKIGAEADTQQELAEQASLQTDAMKVDMLQTGDYFKRLHDQTEKLKHERLTAQEQQRLTATNARIREIEERIALATEGAQVASAKGQAELVQQNVNMVELQRILGQLDIPEKAAMAAWFEKVGSASPAAKAVMSIGQWLKMIFGGGR